MAKFVDNEDYGPEWMWTVKSSSSQHPENLERTASTKEGKLQPDHGHGKVRTHCAEAIVIVTGGDGLQPR